jgi:hypothetical protein
MLIEANYHLFSIRIAVFFSAGGAGIISVHSVVNNILIDILNIRNSFLYFLSIQI